MIAQSREILALMLERQDAPREACCRLCVA
jgi:hypothetical protein